LSARSRSGAPARLSSQVAVDEVVLDITASSSAMVQPRTDMPACAPIPDRR
jgi:hypothetical protein